MKQAILYLCLQHGGQRQHFPCGSANTSPAWPGNWEPPVKSWTCGRMPPPPALGAGISTGFTKNWRAPAPSSWSRPTMPPSPPKLCMLLEKMEEITFLPWWRDNSYRPELSGLPTGIISHGGVGEWARKSYKAMVNGTIANALSTTMPRNGTPAWPCASPAPGKALPPTPSRSTIGPPSSKRCGTIRQWPWGQHKKPAAEVPSAAGFLQA